MRVPLRPSAFSGTPQLTHIRVAGAEAGARAVAMERREEEAKRPRQIEGSGSNQTSENIEPFPMQQWIRLDDNISLEARLDFLDH